ncbi:MAG: PQQ-dependent sugar dehydrogenase [Maricaulaceae bacterium]
MRKLGLSFAAALLLGACAPSQTLTHLNAYPAPSVPVKDVVLDNLKSPWSIAFITDTDVLISEKGGHLLRADLEGKNTSIIEGFPGDVANETAGEDYAGGNNGIFDVLLDPDFSNNQYIYVAYSARQEAAYTTKIIRGRLTGNVLSDVETLFVAAPYTENETFHYGGGMVFGTDGKLYVTIGERLYSEENQPPIPIAQNLADRRGKIYRFNPDGSIPADNPDFGEGAVPGMYAAGIRAAQGLTVHPKTGEIWFSEHGTYRGDEINKLTAGANYGWPIHTTGDYRYGDYDPPKMEERTFTPPVWYWRHTVAPTGLTFYSGDEFPQWEGDLLVPGLSIGSLWRVNFEDGAIIGLETLMTNDRVRTRKVAQSPNGTLYMLADTHLTITPGVGVTDNGGPDGQLIRIRNAAFKGQ